MPLRNKTVKIIRSQEQEARDEKTPNEEQGEKFQRYMHLADVALKSPRINKLTEKRITKSH